MKALFKFTGSMYLDSGKAFPATVFAENWSEAIEKVRAASSPASASFTLCTVEEVDPSRLNYREHDE